jgi:hypothetical protein
MSGIANLMETKEDETEEKGKSLKSMMLELNAPRRTLSIYSNWRGEKASEWRDRSLRGYSPRNVHSSQKFDQAACDFLTIVNHTVLVVDFSGRAPFH